MERVGYWIRTKKDRTHYGYTCNLCKKSSRFYKFPFCPFCGARMVEELHALYILICKLFQISLRGGGDL